MHPSRLRRTIVSVSVAVVLVICLQSWPAWLGSRLVWKKIDGSVTVDESVISNLGNHENSDLAWGRLDDYRLLHKIGEGEYADAFQAIDLRNDRDCVVKMLKAPVDIHAAKREINILRDLNNGPNLIHFVDAVTDVDNRSIGLVTEYVNNTSWENLSLILDDHGVKFYTFQLLRAIEHAHARNIMHRDLKPDNVVVDHSQRKLRVLDWGTSAYYEEGLSFEPHVTTRWWRAPEVMAEYTSYGLAIDVWAFGCMLAALVFQIEPFFPGSDSVDQLLKIAEVLGTRKLFAWLDMNEIVMPEPFHNVTSWYTGRRWEDFINDRNHDRASADAIDLISRLLVYDPKLRLTASDALSHPYFDLVRQEALADLNSFTEWNM